VPVRIYQLGAIAWCVGLLAGCGGGSSMNPSRARAELEHYVREVEPIRLGVNKLLEGADPVLGAFRGHRIGPAAASAQMDQLERRFAALAVDIAAIKARLPVLAGLHAAYAETYVLEDAYLSALVSGLARRDLADLPDTQATQRAAIIRWRTGLEVLAREMRLRLPADVQQAGRGEIAPSPQGSS